MKLWNADRGCGPIYADPSYALDLLSWKVKLGTNQMCDGAWRW